MADTTHWVAYSIRTRSKISRYTTIIANFALVSRQLVIYFINLLVCRLAYQIQCLLVWFYVVRRISGLIRNLFGLTDKGEKNLVVLFVVLSPNHREYCKIILFVNSWFSWILTAFYCIKFELNLFYCNQRGDIRITVGVIACKHFSSFFFIYLLADWNEINLSNNLM